ncbi:hypothetical protein [Ruegeria sp. MALMAid1280]|uniref:hypothetical protein n=1 Tax=Ruegeria sp. MALMAid1280 TaxID=3411634 RepID=UPI003B9DE95D
MTIASMRLDLQQGIRGSWSGKWQTWRAMASSANTGAAMIQHVSLKIRKRIQIARMQSVLNGYTDEQLRKIGVERSEIRRHAETLVNYEYDGL